MPRFDFCGPTYRAFSPTASLETAMNLYPEIMASPNARSRVALVSSPGLVMFGAMPNAQKGFGIFTFNGRTFSVGFTPADGDLHLFEVLATGQCTDRGALDPPNSTAPAIWDANPTQLVFTAAGTGNVYVFNLGTSVLTKVTLSAGPALSVQYLDGFFVALIANSNTFMVSNIEDGTTWQAINTGTISEFADNAVGMVVSNRTIGFIGQKKSVPYYNAGALFPFIPVPGVLIEEGGIATYAMVKLDNTIMWLGGNVDQGVGIAYRLNGYTPTRISNHDVERIWQTYATLTDAIGYTFQLGGHKFWHLYFPTANASWRYDVATQNWHEVGAWNQQTGLYDAHKSLQHTFNFGLHLVADPTSANIFSLSENAYTDNGQILRRLRRATYLADEHEYEFHNLLEILAEMGLPSQIQAPAPYPTFVNFTDANGVLWNLTLQDSGNGVIVPAAAGQVATPGAIVLADNQGQGTFWQCAMTTGGALVSTQVLSGLPTSVPPIAVYQMSTSPSFLASGLQVNAAGIVSSTPVTPYLRAPQLDIRWTDDQGHTWSNVHSVGLGLTGQYKNRAILRRLGRSRNRVYEVACSDPVALRLIDAFVNSAPNNSKPSGRMSDQIRKSA
jgi:hypothetical protein